MELNLAQSLGIDPINTSSSKYKELLFKCWANTPSSGTQKGVRDATPGFLKVIPNSAPEEGKALTKKDIEHIFKHSSRGVVFPFSVMNGAKPRAAWPVPGDMGIILDSLEPITWVDNTEDTEIGCFRDLNFKSVLDSLYKNGPVSITVKSTDKLVSGLVDLSKQVKGLFSYNNLIYTKINKLSSRDLVKYGIPEFRCSFFKPSQCVPFFGENSGGVIHITLTQRKYSSVNGRFIPLFEAVGLFTDNVEAVHNVDGYNNFYGSPKPFTKIHSYLKEAYFIFDHLGVKSTSAK
jgi:hypothetical protein